MLQAVSTVGSTLAGIAALAALLLGLTNSARLHKKEQHYRELVASTDIADTHREALISFHRTLIARLLSREVTSGSPFVVLWIFGIIVIVTYVAVGFYYSEFTQEQNSLNVTDFLVAGLGVGPADGVVYVMTPMLLSIVYGYFVYSLMIRARIERVFSKSGILQTQASVEWHDMYRPVNLVSAQRGRKPSRWKSIQFVGESFSAWFQVIVSGFATASSAFFMGILLFASWGLNGEPSERMLTLMQTNVIVSVVLNIIFINWILSVRKAVIRERAVPPYFPY